MVQALNLPVEEGILIEDVAPQSTAEAAGVKVGDVVATVQGQAVHNIRQFALAMYSYSVGDLARIEVRRGQESRSFLIVVVERGDDPQRFEDLVNEEDNSIVRLGILGLTIDEKIKGLLPGLRTGAGVLVAAKMTPGTGPRFGDELLGGDVIYAVNGSEVKDIASLRSKLVSLADDFPVVLQVERVGRFQFVVLESN